ncbi:hypothetical protein GCM10011613_37240 [Cellvibrio zantedeschiae]|uniref:Uncharacterized protein n=1 Tax=Cellvibrio zantedeschiae TaxID=1237077 RepID=A0ABQ3BC84_9GAMM|nr:hypothetical protein [Cellvibrio zantedeschiae]GGY88902.1 hypothetical protein GCM10011613_37240 [Cellvibrio zantedeschiae]
MKSNLEQKSNESVVNTLVGENSLLDTSVIKIEIYEQEFVRIVSLSLKMRVKSDFELIRLEFLDVEEYGFYSSHNYGNHIERYKFFKTQIGLYYISLDPFNEVMEINEHDQDFVISKSVKFEILK